MNNKLTDLRQKSKIAEKSVNQNQTAKISINDPYKKKDTMISSENNMSLAKNKYVSAEKLLAEISNTKFESADETMINTTKAVSVNPNILLSNVETELNQSFKESALNRLNKNFKTIRTVLVNRNYKD